MNCPTRRQGGYTLIGLVIAVGVLVIAALATVNVAEFEARRSAEKELIEIGNEFDRAFLSYYNLTPAGARRYPQELSDLIKDPRYAGVRRHLRRIYRDPLTSKAEWGVIAAPGGGIMGVYSLAEGIPIRRMLPPGAASAPMAASEPGKEDGYAEWKFGYFPQAILPAGQSMPVAGQLKGGQPQPVQLQQDPSRSEMTGIRP